MKYLKSSVCKNLFILIYLNQNKTPINSWYICMLILQNIQQHLRCKMYFTRQCFTSMCESIAHIIIMGAEFTTGGDGRDFKGFVCMHAELLHLMQITRQGFYISKTHTHAAKIKESRGVDGCEWNH